MHSLFESFVGSGEPSLETITFVVLPQLFRDLAVDEEAKRIFLAELRGYLQRQRRKWIRCYRHRALHVRAFNTSSKIGVNLSKSRPAGHIARRSIEYQRAFSLLAALWVTLRGLADDEDLINKDEFELLEDLLDPLALLLDAPVLPNQWTADSHGPLFPSVEGFLTRVLASGPFASRFPQTIRRIYDHFECELPTCMYDDFSLPDVPSRCPIQV